MSLNPFNASSTDNSQNSRNAARRIRSRSQRPVSLPKYRYKLQVIWLPRNQNEDADSLPPPLQCEFSASGFVEANAIARARTALHLREWQVDCDAQGTVLVDTRPVPKFRTLSFKG